MADPSGATGTAGRRLPKVKVFAVLPSADGTHHLVWRAADPSDGREFHRLLGGHLELGETLLDGVRREIAEETGTTLEDARALGVLENIFTFDGVLGHEIVHLYTGRLADPAIVGPGGGWLADDGEPIRVEWRPFDDADVDLPLYPDGIAGLLDA